MTTLTEEDKKQDITTLREIAMNIMNRLDDVNDFNSKVAIASAFNILMDTSKGL